MPIQISNVEPIVRYPNEPTDISLSDAPAVRFATKGLTLIFTPALPNGLVPGTGDLYVTEESLIWYNPVSKTNITIDYPTILVHAISRGSNDRLTEKPCIYCQLESPTIQEASGDQLDMDESIVSEMRLVPSEGTQLDDIFLAMSECAALHPDQNADEHDDENDWICTDAGQEEQLSVQGQTTLNHLNRLLEANDQQFQDAKSDDEVVDR